MAVIKASSKQKESAFGIRCLAFAENRKPKTENRPFPARFLAPRSSGISLTELMIIMAIMGILGTGLSVFMMNVIKFFRLQDARNAIQQDARNSLSLMNRFLRQGRYTTITIDQASNQPPCSRIEFQTVEPSGTSVTYYKHRFVQQGNKLLHAVAKDSPNFVSFTTSTLSTNLRYIGFSVPRTDDFTIVSVAVTFEKATYQGLTKALQMSVEKVRVMNE